MFSLPTTRHYGSLRALCLFLYASLVYSDIVLPEPKGRYAVTVSSTELVDSSRVDPYDPNHGKRALMISLFYPVERSSCEQTCALNYMPPITAAATDAFLASSGIPNGTLESIKYQACCKVSDRANLNPAEVPVVLFSHGLGGSRLFYSYIAQAVASSGYAVATIDHPYDALVVEFPDGTVVRGIETIPNDPNTDIPRTNAAIYTRVNDSRFVLNQLGVDSVVKSLVPGAPCAFNTTRAAFYGHSFGGATAISALQNDTRFVGALDLDGSAWALTSDVDKPVLLFAAETHNRTNDVTWTAAWERFKGWRKEINLKGAVHNTFTDGPVLIKAAGFPMSNATIQLFGSIEPTRGFDIITTYVKTWLEFVLTGKKESLLEEPSRGFPEISFF